MRNSHDCWARSSLRALRAFETAARLGSFTAAAAALHVTQGAVSRQIHELEAVIGHPLFVRSGPRLTLTDRGRVLAEHLGRIFLELDQAFLDAQGRRVSSTITLSMLPSVAARWLAGRLEAFERTFPTIDLRIFASRHLVDFRVEEIDGAIRFGRGTWPDVEAEFIDGETVSPVCTPEFMARHDLQRPQDLLRVRLFHGDMEEGWRDWFAHAGLVLTQQLRGPRIGDDAATLQAVLNGQGVALGRTLLISDDLVAGRLVRPFAEALPISFGYWFVAPKQRRNLPHFDEVRVWLIEDLRNSLRQVTGAPGR